MAVKACPTLAHILNEDQCQENLAGLGNVVYVGLKSDLAAPLSATDNTYTAPTFKSTKGLYKIDCGDDTQSIVSSNIKGRKGYKQTLTFSIDMVNQITSKFARALNNLDLFFIVPDNDTFQIMYSKYRRCKPDDGGIKSDTGKAPGDDRKTEVSFTLEPVFYPNYFVEITDIEKLIEPTAPGA